MTIDCTVRFENSKELGQFADFWDSLVKSRNPVATESKIIKQKSSTKHEDELRAKMDAESAKIKAGKESTGGFVNPKGKAAEEEIRSGKTKDPEDPTGDPVCTPQEFVEAVRKWHGQDPSTRTALIQRELDVLGIEKLQAIQPKDYPGFLTELGISK